MMKVLATFGVRPDLIKMAPLVREMKAHPDIDLKLAHTGQHFDEEMNGVFLRELLGYEPHQVLKLCERGTGGSAQYLAQVVRGTMEYLQRNEIDHVFVYGDHLATLGVAIGVSRYGGPLLWHVEAGLRSFDLTMPEEMVRMSVDALADVLLAPTGAAVANLELEGRSVENVVYVGNTVADAVEMVRPRIQPCRPWPLPYWLMTMHRPENVDDIARLRRVMQQVSKAAVEADRVVRMLVHPRVRNRLHEVTSLPNVSFESPLSYVDMLGAVDSAELVITDSGGLQEECCIMRTPCMTIRKNTERPESILGGWNVLCTPDADGDLPVSPVDVLRKLNAGESDQDVYPAGASRRIVELLVRAGSNLA
jgi:UDP-N-acetylglucosamine 2-epimerase (non-hydrolysing)